MSGPKPPKDHFTMLYFASATSMTKKKHEFLKAPLALSKLYDLLEGMYPGIKERILSPSALTINLDYVDVAEETAKGEDGLVIQAGDEVAVIPAVSAG